MTDLANIPNFHLKIIFLGHFFMISLANMGRWSSSAYLFYNIFLILFFLWGIYQPEADEPLQMAIMVNAVSIILDIILLAMCFPDSHSANERFSAAMAILHLITRPLSMIFLAKLLQQRSGTSDGIGNLFSGAHNRSYEDMDKNVGSSNSQSSHGGYDFTTAQQI